MTTFKIATNNLTKQVLKLKDDYKIVNILTNTFVEEGLAEKCIYKSNSGKSVVIDFLGTLLPHYFFTDCDSQSGYSTETVKDTYGRLWYVGVRQVGRKDTPTLFAYHWESVGTQLVFQRQVGTQIDLIHELSHFNKDEMIMTHIWKAYRTQTEPYLVCVYSNTNKHLQIGKNAMAGFDNYNNHVKTPYLQVANFDFFIAKYGYADSCLLSLNPYLDEDLTYEQFQDKILNEFNTGNNDVFKKISTGKFHRIGCKNPEMSCKEIFAIATKQTFVSNGEGCEFWVRKSKEGNLVAQMFMNIRGTWFEYELEIPSLTNLDQIAHILKRGCQKKAIQRLKGYNRLTVKKVLRIIPKDHIITLADSLSVGNCEYGSKQFCKKFGLPTDQITFGELLAMPAFTKMSLDYNFIATLKKVASSIKGTDITTNRYSELDEEA